MTFVAPALALALPLVALLAFWFARRDRRRERRLHAVGGARALRLTPELDLGRRRWRRRLFAAALAFGVFAAMQPQWGTVARNVDEPRADAIVCLDVSRSMLARDLSPSRLGRAHAELTALAARAVGARLGLVAFAGVARLVVPLTRDAESFAQMARATDPLSVPLGGTDLGAGLETALTALAAGQGLPAGGDAQVPGTILLLTDGEDLQGRGRAAARRCRERGARVHCIGFGSTLGSKIAVEGADGKEQFLRTRGGDEVVTVMDAASLRSLADAGGGVFAEAGAESEPLLRIWEREVLPHAAAVAREDASAASEKQNRYRWPLAAALGCLLAELWLVERRRAR